MDPSDPAQPKPRRTLHRPPRQNPAEPIVIQDAAVYGIAALAAALKISTRQLARLRESRRHRFPKPFDGLGGPSWRGDAVNAWLAGRQRDANS